MTIIGMMWNRNEADLLPFTIYDALSHVDVLYIADDGSTDKSWDIIQSFKKANPEIEHIQQNPTTRDPGQRQSLLNKIRERYKPEDAWVQVIESDIMILETNIRQAIKDHHVQDIAVSWHALNGALTPTQWDQADTWPYWGDRIDRIMFLAHHMEVMLYTFRPLPKLFYNAGIWRPWPNGFSHHGKPPITRYRKLTTSPLLAHYGFRGPTHFYNKYKHMGKAHKRYSNWKLGSIEEVKNTVSFFNGEWNSGPDVFAMSREGWTQWLSSK